MILTTGEQNAISLKEKLIATIQGYGPLTISQFISFCLADSQFGYYKTAEPFGRDGDFITAPEVSQMFGEMLGIWVVSTWQCLGQPSNFTLCEMGPGRGTLMDDVLRTIKRLDQNCFNHAKIFLCETSLNLRQKQKERLAPHNRAITWIDQFADLPPCPLILIANELFDCLPIHQYIFDGKNWRERMVGVNNDGQDLIFGTGSSILSPYEPILPYEITEPIKEGTIIEVSPARETLMAEIASHIAKNRGAALIIDYGAIEPKPSDTLQAMSKHQFSHVLENPGLDDLTSHVDFAALAHCAKQNHCQTQLMTQGEFLLALGLIERAQNLGRGRNTAFQEKIRSDVERLAANNQMGGLFKVLCVSDINTMILPFGNQP